MGELAIRRATPTDLRPIARLYEYYVTHSAITFDLEPRGAKRWRTWLDGFAATGPYQLFVAEDESGTLGYAGSQVFRPKAAYATSVETSIYVEPAQHRTGIGRSLYARLFSALSSEAVHRAYAAITLPNPASVALHEHFGFRPVGTMHEVGHKHGRYWDVGWFEKAFGTPPGN